MTASKFPLTKNIKEFPLLTFSQYCYLSAIFWLHAMNFHVWRGLRSMRPDPDAHLGGASSSGGRHGWKTKRFKRYAVYAWSGPTITIAITFLMQVPNFFYAGFRSTVLVPSFKFEFKTFVKFMRQFMCVKN